MCARRHEDALPAGALQLDWRPLFHRIETTYFKHSQIPYFYGNKYANHECISCTNGNSMHPS